jgi:molecular chaperone DnaK (HSP70)
MKKELIKLRDDLEKKLIKCDTVEIVGGCTRIPAV